MTSVIKTLLIVLGICVGLGAIIAVIVYALSDKDTCKPACSSSQSCVNSSCRDNCNTSKPCAPPLVCTNGTCQARACTTNTLCTSPAVCRDGLCQNPACTANADCTSPAVCRNGACQNPVCVANTDCTSPAVCRNGVCQNPESCTSNAQCAPLVCKAGSCVPECSADEHCPAPLICRNGSCAPECTNNGQCGPGEECSENACRPTCTSFITLPCSRKNGVCVPGFDIYLWDGPYRWGGSIDLSAYWTPGEETLTMCVRDFVKAWNESPISKNLLPMTIAADGKLTLAPFWQAPASTYIVRAEHLPWWTAMGFDATGPLKGPGIPAARLPSSSMPRLTQSLKQSLKQSTQSTTQRNARVKFSHRFPSS